MTFPVPGGSTFLRAKDNLSDVASESSARTHLGLGSAALLAAGAVAQTANNLSDLASAATARTNLGLGAVATEAYVSGQLLCAPASYAPGSQTALTTTSATMAAVSSANVNTGSFTAPASGDVIVSASFVAQVSASSTVIGVGLAAHGTVTPMIGNVQVMKIPSATEPLPYTLEFLITGLTPGTAYDLDLTFCTSTGTLTVFAFGVTSVTPTGGGAGAPVLMTVQAV